MVLGVTLAADVMILYQSVVQQFSRSASFISSSLTAFHKKEQFLKIGNESPRRSQHHQEGVVATERTARLWLLCDLCRDDDVVGAGKTADSP